MSLLKIKNNYQNKVESKFIEPKVHNIINHNSESLKEVNNSKHNLMIGEGVTINGNIKSDNEVIIQGSVEGDIQCNSITIDNSGNLKGKIKAENMTVKGKVEGEININNLLEIKSKGNASGKIFYGGIQIDEEGKLAGEINFKDSNNKQDEFKDWKSL
jgi:cytoskeletal protein CcmA (bactofilin family)